MTRFLMTNSTIDAVALRRELLRAEAGGFCSFEGWVRQTNGGRQVTGIDYDAYVPLAVTEAQAVLNEALTRFDVTNVVAAHCCGYLQVGEIAVWIGVAAPHRAAAFSACRYVIDEIKKRVPIWKREHYVDGNVGWVACHDSE